VTAANFFACISGIGFAGDRHPDIIDKSVWDSLGVNYDAFEEIEPVVSEEIEKAKIFLKL